MLAAFQAALAGHATRQAKPENRDLSATLEVHPRQSSSQAGAPLVEKKTGAISGRVLRAEDGHPLGKANVTLLPDAQGADSVTLRTSSNGTFEFKEVMPGLYRLRAERTAYVSQVYGQRGGGPGIQVKVEEGRIVERIEFRLLRAGVISGSVVDEDQEPVEGVLVRAMRVIFSPGGGQQVNTVRSGRTDDLGNYRLPRLAPGNYYVSAGGSEGMSVGGRFSSTGYRTSFYPAVTSYQEATRIQVSAGEEVRRIDLTAYEGSTFTIHGLIVDRVPSDGKKQYNVGFAQGGAYAVRSVDRQDGRFALRGVAPGSYVVVGIVSGERGDQARAYRPVKIVDSDVSVVIEVGRSAEVQGEARAEGDGEFSFSGLAVELVPETERGVRPSGRIDTTGVFQMRDVPEGDYRFKLEGRSDQVYLKEARCEGQDRVREPLPLVSGQVVEQCALVVGRDVATVAGAVTEKDKTISGAVVVMVPAEEDRRRVARHTAIGQTDANGQFQIRGVIPGEYFAFAMMPLEDAAYYDLEFPNRNRDRVERVIVKPSEPLFLKLRLLGTAR